MDIMDGNGETTIFQLKIWIDPIETTFQKWDVSRQPGSYWTACCWVGLRWTFFGLLRGSLCCFKWGWVRWARRFWQRFLGNTPRKTHRTRTWKYLEDHPRTCKWLGSPPFISHKYRPFIRGPITPPNIRVYQEKHPSVTFEARTKLLGFRSLELETRGGWGDKSSNWIFSKNRGFPTKMDGL